MKRVILTLMGIGILVFAVAVGAHEPAGVIYAAVHFPPGNESLADGNPSEWDVVPDDQYGIQDSDLYPLHGLHAIEQAGGSLGQGEMDRASLALQYKVGWSDAKNRAYYYMRVFDDEHVVRRQELRCFYWDDAIETFFAFGHFSLDDMSAKRDEGLRISFEYTFVVPPLEDSWEFAWSRDLEWVTSGSKWYTFGWSFDGDQLGESTYHYELSALAVSEVPNADANPEDVVETDLNEGDILHFTLSLGDADGNDGFRDTDAGEGDLRIGGYWSTATTPAGSGAALSDLLLAPIDGEIPWPTPRTSVEATSWGRIKAQF